MEAITQKKKVSRFEFALIEALNDPEYAKDYEPYTEQEELNQRKENIQKQANKLTWKQLKITKK